MIVAVSSLTAWVKQTVMLEVDVVIGSVATDVAGALYGEVIVINYINCGCISMCELCNTSVTTMCIYKIKRLYNLFYRCFLLTEKGCEDH